MKVRFAYMTHQPEQVKKVEAWFGIKGMTINREWWVEVDEQGMKELRMFEELGLVHVREVEEKK